MGANKTKKGLWEMCVFLVVILMVSGAAAQTIWDGTANTDWYGDGSASSFTLNTAEDLAGFAELVNDGNSFSGKTVKLGTNILLNDISDWDSRVTKASVSGTTINLSTFNNSDKTFNQWTPISNTKIFAGTFDGDGYTVNGIYIDTNITYAGFFGVTANNSIIKNVNIEKSFVKTVRTSGNAYAGGLVGSVNSSNTSISNCYITSDVVASGNNTYCGGLTGEASSSIFGCYVTADIASSSIAGNSYAGGLVGYSYSSTAINNCYAKGDIISSAPDANYSNVGGFAARAVASSITNSYAIGNIKSIKGTARVGGLVGSFGNTSSINNCYYSGIASYESASESYACGGFGQYDNGGTVTNCYYNSSLTSQGTGYGAGNLASGALTGKTTTEMQAAAFVSLLNTNATTANGSIADADKKYRNWGSSSGVQNGYPLFGTPLNGGGSGGNAGISIKNKTYDGTVTAELDLSMVELLGATGDDDVSLNASGVSAFFSDKNVGSNKTITVFGKFTLSGTDAEKYTLIEPDLSALTANITAKSLAVSWSDSVFTYDGTAKKPTASVTTGVTDETLTPSVSGEQTAAGTYSATASISNNNYTLTGATQSFRISPKALTVTGVSVSNKVYDGTTSATIGGATLNGVISDDDVTLVTTGVTAAFTDDANVGTSKGITVSGSYSLSGGTSANYSLTQPTLTGLTANITAKTLTAAMISDISAQTYTGSAITPTVTVADGEALTADDYEVAYSSNTNAGTATVTVTAKNNYTGTPTKNFTISPKTLTSAMITDISAQTYTGSAITPAVTVADGEALTTNDYDVAYSSNTNAGTATVTVTAKNNYTGTPTKNFTISPKTLTSAMISDISAQTYTGSAITPTVTVTDGEALTTNDYEVAYSSNTNAGTATVTVTAKNNYTGTPTKNFTISPKEISVNWGSLAFTHDGNAKKPTATVETGVTGETVTLAVSVSGGSDAIDIGSYTAIASMNPANSNYTLTNYEKEFIITDKEAISVSWGDAEFTYNGSARTPTASALDSLDNNIPLTITILSGSAVNAGNYTAVASMTTPNPDLVLTNDTLNFTISPRTVTLTWSDDSVFTYNGTEQYRSATVTSGIIGEEDVPLSFSGATNAGKTNSTASTTNSNYVISNSSKSFTILAKEVSVNWSDTVLTYNGVSQKPTASITGVGDEGTIPLTVSGAQTNAGTGYEATATVGSIINYSLAAATTTAIFRITQKSATVLWTDTLLTYNGTAQKPKANIVGVGGDGIITLSVSGEETNAGNYSATASTANANYTLTGATKDFSISKKALSIVWNDTVFTYNGIEQKPTATAATGITGETVALTVSGGETNAGSYSATASMTIVNNNYTLTGTSKNFTIGKKQLSVAWTDTVFTYNGTEQKPTASAATGITGETVALTVSGGETNAGSYSATASMTTANNNYTLTGTSKNFTIEKKQVSVIWSDTVFTYNGTSQKPTAEATGINDEAMELSISGAATNAGTHTATASVENINYILTGNTQEFSIAKKALTVTLQQKTYEAEIGSSFPTFTPVFSGFIDGETEAVLSGTLTISGYDIMNPGEYPLTLGGLTSINYTISYNNEGLLLSVSGKMEGSITVVCADVVYGKAPAPTNTKTGDGEVRYEYAVSSDSPIYTVIVPTAVGEYLVRAHLSEGSIYKPAVSEAVLFNILKAPLTVTANDITKNLSWLAKKAGGAYRSDIFVDSIMTDFAIDSLFSVSYQGLVNGDTPASLGGKLAFDCVYEHKVGEYFIIPKGLSSGSYDITFEKGVLKLTDNRIVVTLRQNPVNRLLGNASITVTLPETGTISLVISDNVGNVVYNTDVSTDNSGRAIINWDLKNRSGVLVSSGSYAIMVEGKGKSGQRYLNRTMLGVSE